ncbi:MAG: M48 family metallopeptidase [Planctomycetota bacterium]|nr:M48 family metallopeptidase [Planctomycetota bacterium]
MKRVYLLLPMLFLLLAGCSSVIGTGRSQMNVVSTEQERELGEEAFKEATAQVKIIPNGKEARMVRQIGSRIVEAAEILYPSSNAEEYDWTFVLIDDDEVANAWAAPGGKIAVYTGILPITKTEAGLAVVIAHEIAHVLAHHSAEQLSHALVMNGVATAGGAVLGGSDSRTREIAMQVMGVGGQYGVALPFSRLHESEADELGLFLMAEAGYNPRQAIGVWQRMADFQEERAPEFLSTHPDPENRIEEFRELMPEAMELYRNSRAR